MLVGRPTLIVEGREHDVERGSEPPVAVMCEDGDRDRAVLAVSEARDDMGRELQLSLRALPSSVRRSRLSFGVVVESASACVVGSTT